MKNLPDINELVSVVEKIAANHLMPHFGQISRQYKADKSIVTEADLATQKALISELKKRWPAFDFLAEEMTAQEQELQMASAENGLWIIDPLDGTSNFAAGIPYFAISIALYYKGKVRLGLVYDPNRKEAFCASDRSESTCNGHSLKASETPSELERAIGVIDFKRLPDELAIKLVTQQPFSSQRSFGSVALDWCWLSANRFHVYLHGRSNIWDYAAGELIFRQAGGHSCTLDGEPVFQPTVQPRSAVGALDAHYFRQWTDYLEINLQ